ncbi:hypothetical protein ACA910_020410 [Epithemia clementina (nom. ined.)]
MEGDDCVFCLQPILVHPNQNTTTDNNTIGGSSSNGSPQVPPLQPLLPSPPSFGSAHPCGHCFHVECFEAWRKHEENEHFTLWQRLGWGRNNNSHMNNDDDDDEDGDNNNNHNKNRKLKCPICRSRIQSFERIVLNYGKSSPQTGSRSSLLLLSTTKSSQQHQHPQQLRQQQQEQQQQQQELPEELTAKRQPQPEQGSGFLARTTEADPESSSSTTFWSFGLAAGLITGTVGLVLAGFVLGRRVHSTAARTSSEPLEELYHNHNSTTTTTTNNKRDNENNEGTSAAVAAISSSVHP